MRLLSRGPRKDIIGQAWGVLAEMCSRPNCAGYTHAQVCNLFSKVEKHKTTTRNRVKPSTNWKQSCSSQTSGVKALGGQLQIRLGCSDTYAYSKRGTWDNFEKARWGPAYSKIIWFLLASPTSAVLPSYLLKSYDSSPFPGTPNSTHSVRRWILAKTDASRRMPYGESENLELRFTCKYLSSFSSLFRWCANVLAYPESFGKQNTNLFPSLLTFIQGSRAVRGRWDYEDVVVGGSLMGEEQSGKM